MAGGCTWQGGIHGRGHAWQGVCGMGGACMAGGGMHGGGRHAWWGACMAGVMCGRGGGVHGRGACMAGHTHLPANTMRYCQ